MMMMQETDGEDGTEVKEAFIEAPSAAEVTAALEALGAGDTMDLSRHRRQTLTHPQPPLKTQRRIQMKARMAAMRQGAGSKHSRMPKQRQNQSLMRQQMVLHPVKMTMKRSRINKMADARRATETKRVQTQLRPFRRGWPCWQSGSDWRPVMT